MVHALQCRAIRELQSSHKELQKEQGNRLTELSGEAQLNSQG